MITLPAIRWGEPYESLEVDEIKHFLTGEPVARVNTVGSGIVARDAKKSRRARQALQSMSPAQLIDAYKKAGELFESGTLAVGDGWQSPTDFANPAPHGVGLGHRPIDLCRLN